jgi:hypothetical protein
MNLYDSSGRKLQALPENAAQESGGNLQTLSVGQQAQLELLQLLLREQQITNKLLAEGSGISDSDVQGLRDDPNFP